MKLFVYPNLYSNKHVDDAIKLIHVLKNNGLEVSISKNDSAKIFGNEEFFLFSPSEADYIVSFGGDSIVLKSAKEAIKYGKPIFGINNGHVGYLCAFNAQEIEQINEKAINELTATKRIVLEVEHHGSIFYAVNDVIIGKENFGKIISVEYQIDKEEKIKYKGDGLIVATPTGSTAYNQSAYGIVVPINEPLLAITPICPLFKTTKPVTVKNDSVISIASPFSYENKSMVYIDGNNCGELIETITIKKSEMELLLLVRRNGK